MGNKTSIKALNGSGAPSSSSGPQSKTTKSVPVHTNSHCGQTYGHCRIPSRSFGSNPAWHCASDNELLTLFNSTFPLPSQQSWTVFRLNRKTVTRVISALRMQPFALDDWRRLPSPGRLVGAIGEPTSQLWDSIRIYNRQVSNSESEASQPSHSAYTPNTMDGDDRYRLGFILCGSVIYRAWTFFYEKTLL
jgi:hypothetical protein